jgi:hypothetical protein
MSGVRKVIIQLPLFTSKWRRAKMGLTDEDLKALEITLMERPDAGSVMKGTGGLRKARFAPPSWSVGKSGALRICYVHFPAYDRLYLVTMFAKNEQDNLTAAERNAIRAVVERIGDALAAGVPHA